MLKEQKMVEEFHKTFDLLYENYPKIVDDSNVIQLRNKLHREEVGELYTAMCLGSLEDIADGIADLLYVTLGTAISYGINIEPIFAEVHRSNMTKLDGYNREDGKWMKGEKWEPPNLKPILEAQKG